MSHSAKLSDLIMALEMDSEEYENYFDRDTGLMVSVDSSILRRLEDGEHEDLEDIPEWQVEMKHIARAIVNDNGSRFVNGPDKFDFHEYRQMECFIRSLDDEAAANQLWRAIKGTGAFRYFKDTLHRLGIQDEWYRFRDQAMKRFVEEWAEANNVPFEDDTNKSAR